MIRHPQPEFTIVTLSMWSGNFFRFVVCMAPGLFSLRGRFPRSITSRSFSNPNIERSLNWSLGFSDNMICLPESFVVKSERIYPEAAGEIGIPQNHNEESSERRRPIDG